MIEVVVVDLAALLLAPELHARLALSQMEKDCLKLYCYAQLPRENVRRALRLTQFLEYFDGLFYDELMPELTSAELRLLKSDRTLWLRFPEHVHYPYILQYLTPRKRLLPRAVRALAKESNLDVDT